MRPFILFGGDGAIKNPGPEDDTAPVIQDFRPANYQRDPIPEVITDPKVEAEASPKAPDSSATGSASDSETGDSKKSTQDSSTGSSQEKTANTQSHEPGNPASVAKVNLLHPSTSNPGNSKPPASE